jgi:hypothetical protein
MVRVRVRVRVGISVRVRVRVRFMTRVRLNRCVPVYVAHALCKKTVIPLCLP